METFMNYPSEVVKKSHVFTKTLHEQLLWEIGTWPITLALRTSSCLWVEFARAGSIASSKEEKNQEYT